mmetsp:Transcript_1805/g.3804  ORF Transcript_1805/g.3804 Transcript_1805/m.3804 type:complete len:274 (-) Transcript_1805:436-1257(-)
MSTLYTKAHQSHSLCTSLCHTHTLDHSPSVFLPVCAPALFRLLPRSPESALDSPLRRQTISPSSTHACGDAWTKRNRAQAFGLVRTQGNSSIWDDGRLPRDWIWKGIASRDGHEIVCRARTHRARCVRPTRNFAELSAKLRGKRNLCPTLRNNWTNLTSSVWQSNSPGLREEEEVECAQAHRPPFPSPDRPRYLLLRLLCEHVSERAHNPLLRLLCTSASRPPCRWPTAYFSMIVSARRARVTVRVHVRARERARLCARVCTHTCTRAYLART